MADANAIGGVFDFSPERISEYERLPDHVKRLEAPIQVWEYVVHLQAEIERLREAVDFTREAMEEVCEVIGREPDAEVVATVDSVTDAVLAKIAALAPADEAK